MFSKLIAINSFTLAVALVFLFGGVAYALTRVTRDVSATVDVQVSAPNGIEIYLDAARTLPANNISFGTVVVDPFGTPATAGSNPVPVWVENQSNSVIELTLTDDFSLGNVMLRGSSQSPILQPGEVLLVELMLNFHQGLAGNYPFTVIFQAEGPMQTPVPTGVQSARDSITLVMPEEPAQLNPLQSIGASTNAYVTRDNVAEPLTWQSGDDQRIVPTSATESWEQMGPNQWRFQLRQGVKFSNGEAYNAEAAVPSLEFLGDGTNNNSSFPYTSGFHPVAVDEFTLDIMCDEACPIFPNTAFFTGIQAPGYLAENPTLDSRARTVVGFGPYVLTEWNAGVSIIQEAYEDFIPVGDHYEFQEPLIKDVTWVWRGEPTVMVAMVKTQEADLAWDVSVDAAEDLSEDMIAFGSSAEVYAFSADTLWDPEMKKKEVRQAINHAINCQEIVDSLYNGLTECVGNIIWNGVIGASEENTAPYEYNPEKARQLLQQAGYDPSHTIEIYTRATRIPKQVEIVEAYQAYMGQVGINAEINIIESAHRQERTACGIGNTLNQVLTDSGRDPATAIPTREDFQLAIDRGELCPRGAMMENESSNETLDFGRQANWYMNCTFVRSTVCDPSPGGIQDMLPAAVSAGGEERQMRMQQLADIMHNDSLFIFAFKLPIVYAKDPKLEFHPRFDGRLRVNHLWFRP